jgi:hypothetical protein
VASTAISVAEAFRYTRAMPRYTVTGPDSMDYNSMLAGSPLDALYCLHADALGPDAVRGVEGELMSRIRPNRRCAWSDGR